MPLAEEALAELLRRGERARLRGSTRAVQVDFIATGSPYWRQDYAQRQHCHVSLAAAERAGAVELRWARQGGDDRPLEKVRLVDVDRLAAHLGTTTVDATVREARALLDPWLDGVPRVAELVEAWSRLKSPRGLGSESASGFADALRVLDALRQGQGDDQIVRVVSRNLFRDSKRIEALARHIDLLTAPDLASPARRAEEVFNALGLVKEPQPFLVAGTGHLHLEASPDCPIARPFVGVSNRHVTGYSGTPAWVLSIENLTTFHQASQHRDAGNGLVLYTGGMPSPSWRRACSAILASLPEKIPVYHWGDIDQGGFRIAAHLRGTCARRHAFHPWLMDAAQLDAAACCTTTDAIRDDMARHAREAGWEALARCMPARTAEQEGIAVRLPGASDGVRAD